MILFLCMRPDSSCSPGVFKSSVDAELGAIGAASELSGTRLRAGCVRCRHLLSQGSGATVMMMMVTSLGDYAKANTSESSNNIPQPPSCFSRLSCSLLVRCAMFCLQCKDTDTGAVSYSLFSFNAWSGVVFYPLILSRKC